MKKNYTLTFGKRKRLPNRGNALLHRFLNIAFDRRCLPIGPGAAVAFRAGEAGGWRRAPFLAGFLFLVMMVSVLGACAGRNTPPPPPGSLAAMFQSDTALFQEGYAQLRGEDRPVNYVRARAAFSLLLEKYPKSKWRGYTETYLRLLAEAETLRTESQSLRHQRAADREEAAARQAALEKELQALRPLADKGRADTVRLQQENQTLRQENEQLKKNLDSLKLLEIEMQRRDRLYR